MNTGIVYTETVIYSAPEAFARDLPYQTAIISLDGGGRVSGRIVGDRVAIDDRVIQVETDEAAEAGLARMTGVPFFRKAP